MLKKNFKSYPVHNIIHGLVRIEYEFSSFISPGHGGNSILHYAAKSANLETIRYCLGQGMQANRLDELLGFYLIEIKIKLFVNSLNYEGETPLHLIAEIYSNGKYKSSYFRVKLKRIKFELYTEPDLDQT